jgi:hypothetical protein
VDPKPPTLKFYKSDRPIRSSRASTIRTTRVQKTITGISQDKALTDGTKIITLATVQKASCNINLNPGYKFTNNISPADEPEMENIPIFREEIRPHNLPPQYSVPSMEKPSDQNPAKSAYDITAAAPSFGNPVPFAPPLDVRQPSIKAYDYPPAGSQAETTWFEQYAPPDNEPGEDDTEHSTPAYLFSQKYFGSQPRY